MPNNLSNKLDALVKIVNLLDMRKPLTPATMAKTLGVGERTIYRYLRSLQVAGYPIYFDKQQRSYHFAEGFQLKRPEFGPQLYDLFELKRCVINSSSVGIAVFRQSGQCLLANDAIGQILAMPQEQLLSQNFHKLASWKCSGLLDVAENILHSGTEQHRELCVPITTDKEVWIACTLTPFESRGAHYLLMVAYDITRLKQAQQHLQENDSVTWKIMELLPVGIIWSDKTGQVEHFNGHFSERYGWTREDIPTFRIWLHHAYPDPAYRESISRRWKLLRDKALQDGSMTILMETTITCKDGTMRPVTITTRLADGQALAVFTDQPSEQ